MDSAAMQSKFFGRYVVDVPRVIMLGFLVVMAGLLVDAVWVQALPWWPREAKVVLRAVDAVVSGDPSEIGQVTAAGAIDQAVSVRKFLVKPMKGWYQQNGAEELLGLIGSGDRETAALVHIRRHGGSWVITEVEVGHRGTPSWWMGKAYEARWESLAGWDR